MRRFVFVSLTALSLCSLALAQPANPLDPRQPGQANPGQAGADAPPVNLQKVFVPDFVKPGASFFYNEGSGSFTPNQNPNMPMNSGAVGITRYDVLAVTDSEVLLKRVMYLQRGNNLTYATSGDLAIDQMKVVGGATFWTDMRVVDGFKPDKDLTITHGPFPLNGVKYECTTVERITRDASARQFWDRGTGLLLASQLATGRVLGQDLFNRDNTSSQQFISYRPAVMPWVDDPQPEWSRTVRKMVYEGANTMHQVNGPPIPIRYRATNDFLEHNDGWAKLNVTVEMEWQQPATSPAIASNLLFGNWWISPDALKRMQPGELWRNDATRSTVTYDVSPGPNGQQLGYISEVGENNFFVLRYGYDLNDGALVHFFKLDRELNTTTESVLVGRE